MAAVAIKIAAVIFLLTMAVSAENRLTALA